MGTQPDFTLYDRFGRLAAVIEVRANRGTSSQWAADFRRNLRGLEAFRYPPFFLLVTPDRLYLWKEGTRTGGPDSSPVPPDYEVFARPLFEPYLQDAHLKLDDVNAPGFELLVMSWLRDLTLQLPNRPLPPQLRESGLAELARDGRITFPAAA